MKTTQDQPWMKEATQIAGDVYKQFLQTVVNQHVMQQRVGLLGKESQKKLDAGKSLDPRFVHLMSISGKGGWHDDPEKFKKYAKNSNVSLLDHLLSVVRGALMFYALDYYAQNFESVSDTSHDNLKFQLKLNACIAFLHDLDKDLQLDRNTELSLEAVEDAMQRYGFAIFLGEDCPTAAQMRYLIEKVEVSQSYAHPCQVPYAWDLLPKYVALADKLDGIWLADDGGSNGVIQRLAKDETLHTSIFKHWRVIRLFDPHHPFLLDELQRHLSQACLNLSHINPLFEVHHDGELLMLLPEKNYEHIVDTGIDQLCKNLPFQLNLMFSTQASPSLQNKKPSFDGLKNFIDILPEKELNKLLQIKYNLRAKLSEALDDMLSPYLLAPHWPNKDNGLLKIYDKLTHNDVSLVRQAALLNLFLNLTNKQNNIISIAEREQQLIDHTNHERPEWINSIENLASRLSITALWVTSLAQEDDSTLDESIWDEDGLLQQWWDDETQPLSACVEGVEQFEYVGSQVKQRFQSLLHQQRVIAPDEAATARCLFSDEPVPFDDTINSTSGLYSVKVSAFSGRDGRPEYLTRGSGHTNVSPVAIAEHKLRHAVHQRQGGKDEGVPTLISSPSVAGLFASFKIPSDKDLVSRSLYDLNRFDMKKGIVHQGYEVYEQRYRMARLEAFARTTEGQINQIRMLLSASLRVGRPFHVFRGLPTKHNAFFYFDAMPTIIADLIGSKSLRIEQIPLAIHRLKFAQNILEENGLGYDVLRLYANAHTRFQSICFIWSHLSSQEKSDQHTLKELVKEFTTLKEKTMTNNDGALVRLGELASKVQQKPYGNSSNSEDMLTFKLCMDTAIASMLLEQNDSTSLTYAIAGELEMNLDRKGKVAAAKYREGSLSDACLEVATHFVQHVWHNICASTPPSQRDRRILGSIYRMSFLQHLKQRQSDS